MKKFQINKIFERVHNIQTGTLTVLKKDTAQKDYTIQEHDISKPKLLK